MDLRLIMVLDLNDIKHGVRSYSNVRNEFSLIDGKFLRDSYTNLS